MRSTEIYSIRVYDRDGLAEIHLSRWTHTGIGKPLVRHRMVTTTMPARRATDPRTVLRAVLEQLIQP